MYETVFQQCCPLGVRCEGDDLPWMMNGHHLRVSYNIADSIFVHSVDSTIELFLTCCNNDS